MALTKKEQAFIEHYLICWNGAEAARQAGYAERSARQTASRMLTKADIKAVIDTRMKELAMSADEVLARLADQARATIGDFVEIDAKGKPEIRLTSDKLHLLKSIKIRPTEFGTAYEFEMYDAQQALVHLGRNRQIFTDKTDITSAGGQLNFNILPAPPVSDSDVNSSSSSDADDGS